MGGWPGPCNSDEVLNVATDPEPAGPAKNAARAARKQNP